MALGLHKSSRRGGRTARRAPMAEINVTPFVDVMLVLLIIFMVTAPLLAAGVPVELPEANANPLDQTPDQITVSIDPQGQIYVDDEPLDDGAFAVRLDEIALSVAGEQPLVNLRADRALEYGRVMAVMGELNRAGFTSISMITNSSSSAP